jgi:hypothetical protein
MKFSLNPLCGLLRLQGHKGRRHLHIKYNSFREDKNKLIAEVFTACLRAYKQALALGGGMSEDENR